LNDLATQEEPAPGSAPAAQPRRCDVLVIGGGPGGSATAVFLARQGLETVLVERDAHPRFHIGESLLPQSLPILDELGVLERVRETGVYKPGAEFISEDGETEVIFWFNRALLGGPGHAFQVLRSEFDEILFRHATQQGVTTLERTDATVRELREDGALVRTTGPGGEVVDWETRFLVDASGRSTVTSKMLAQKRPDPRNTSAAIFDHFHGIPMLEGERAGNIRIYLTDPGWMWQIPLPGGATSVGLVAPGEYMRARGGGIEALFKSHVARHPHIAAMVAQGTSAGRLQATGNFSYRATEAAGPSHVKVGDAYGFLDPIFSTGVHLALTSAREAAAAIRDCLARPSRRAARLAAYDRAIRKRITFVSWFVYMIHDPAFRHMMLHPKNVLGVELAVISMLSGDFEPNLRLRSRIALFKLLRYSVGLRGRVEPVADVDQAA
jgi:flavin-dependent dehydrogenase